MKMEELNYETISYKNRNYNIWTLDINGEKVEVGEIDIEKALIGDDGEPNDEEAFYIDERIGYYCESDDEINDVINSYLDT